MDDEIETAMKQNNDNSIKAKKKLLKIITELKVAKNQYNQFGNFHYRSLDDIIDGLRPLCAKYGIVYTLSDTIQCVGNRFYVVATVRAYDADTAMEIEDATGWAREVEHKGKFDDSQLTGSASTYARKLALCGLFCISEGTEIDATDADKGKQETKVKLRPRVIPLKNYNSDDVVRLLQEHAKKTGKIIPYENFMYTLFGPNPTLQNVNYLFDNKELCFEEYTKRLANQVKAANMSMKEK